MRKLPRVIKFQNLTEEDRERFIRAWKDIGAYVEGYETESRWCCPWQYDEREYETYADSIEELAKEYWEYNAKTILEDAVETEMKMLREMRDQLKGEVDYLRKVNEKLRIEIEDYKRKFG